MNRRPGLWLAIAAVFTLGNLAGAVWAAALLEGMHTAAHVAGTLIGAWWTWRLVARRPRAAEVTNAVTDERIEQLQQSVDAVALELERLGEAQRFSEKLRTAPLAERPPADPVHPR